MIKIEIYEKTREYITGGVEPGERIYEDKDVLRHKVESEDKVVLAAFLRGVADSYSPPPKPTAHYRGVE